MKKSAPVEDMFASAPVVVSSKKSSAAKSEERVPTMGLAKYGAVDAFEKELKAIKDIVRPEVTEIMIDHFLTNKGQNYKGIEDDVAASLELRKRSTTSELTEVEIELCAQNGISTMVVEDRPDTFIFNPDSLAWLQDHTQEVSAFLKKMGAPEDTIMRQKSTKKTVVTEESINEVFRLNDRDTIRTLLPIVGVPSIRVTKKPTEAGEILKTVSALMGVKMVEVPADMEIEEAIERLTS